MTHTAGLLSVPAPPGGTVVVVTKPTRAAAGGDPEVQSHGALPASDRDLPLAGHTGPWTQGRLLVDEVLMYGAAPMSVEKLKQAIQVIGR